jgi:hypothetical protein
VIGAVAFFVDGKRAVIKRLGLGEAVRGLKQNREIVEVDRRVGMIGAIVPDDPTRSSPPEP